MSTLRVILGDQLNIEMSSLADIGPNDLILMAEVRSEATYVKHHKKKIAYIFSAMRHFAKHLKEQGQKVRYVCYDSDTNTGSLYGEVKHCIEQYQFDRVVIAQPAEQRLFSEVQTWSERLQMTVDITEDNRFVASQCFFSQWAEGRKQLRMEYFYREMRKQNGYLMDGDKPCGGQWNFDSENRKKLPANHEVPEPSKFAVDSITQDVINLVNTQFADHFGELVDFHYAVTREQALQVLKEFVEQRLVNFGTYQDAMTQNEPWMYHSHVSFYLNNGLLMPHEVMQAVEQAYVKGDVPINSAEGFIRQVLGWREYVRGFYWHFMPGYEKKNYLQAERALPDFFWTAKTKMNCLSQCIKETKANAYAHHIQRLMVLGNFALLAGLSPEEVNEWYLIVYADAYEWVELPNVSGMVLFADGGNLASKPYAASGAYIHKMSNYCQHCEYSVKEKTGEQACPFNYLYWHFLHRHIDKFKSNPRMAMIYRTMQKMDESKVESMLRDGEKFLMKLENNEEV